MLSKPRFEWRRSNVSASGGYFIFDTFTQEQVSGSVQYYKTQRQAGLVAKRLNDEYTASLIDETVVWRGVEL